MHVFGSGQEVLYQKTRSSVAYKGSRRNLHINKMDAGIKCNI